MILRSLLTLAAVVLGIQPAYAHGVNTLTTDQAGMLQFNAVTQLAMPDHNSDWFDSGQVRVKSDSFHRVSIVDPFGGNSTVNGISYDLFVQVNSVTPSGTGIYGRNASADIMGGSWIRLGTDDHWVSVPFQTGQSATAHAQLWWSGQGVDTGPSVHGHTFNAYE